MRERWELGGRGCSSVECTITEKMFGGRVESCERSSSSALQVQVQAQVQQWSSRRSLVVRRRNNLRAGVEAAAGLELHEASPCDGLPTLQDPTTRNCDPTELSTQTSIETEHSKW